MNVGTIIIFSAALVLIAIVVLRMPAVRTFLFERNVKNVFNHQGKSFHNGILVRAKFFEGNNGVLYVHTFEELNIDTTSSDGLDLTVKNGKEWCGAQEPPKYSGPREPYNRTGYTAYIPRSLEELEILATSNGGRFLSLQHAWIKGNLSTTAFKDGTFSHEIAVVITDRQELDKFLGKLLPRMGVPKRDVAMVKANILEKIGQ